MDTNTQEPSAFARNRSTIPWQPFLLILLVVAMIILTRVYGLDDYFGEFRLWIDRLGPWGPIVFTLLYASLVTLAIPGSALTIIAGALFGSILGILVVSTAATLGAAFSFLLARYLARDSTAEWLAGNKTFQKLDDLTEKHGAIIVALTRLIPLFPFNLLNYSFGLTRIPFWTYLFWSWLCMLPGVVFYVVGADAVARLLSEGQIPWVLFAFLALIGGVLVLLGWSARKKLRSKENS